MAMIPRDCEVEFVGEGASNLVFKLTPPDDSSSHALLEGTLPTSSIPSYHAISTDPPKQASSSEYLKPAPERIPTRSSRSTGRAPLDPCSRRMT